MTFTRIRQVVKSALIPARNQPPFSHLVQLGDPVLRVRCEEIPPETIKTKEVQTLVQHMISVMRNFDCVGLAANQIGMPYRIIIMEFNQSSKKQFSPTIQKLREMEVLPLTVLINPVLKPNGFEKVTFTEACGSVKGYSAEVPRYKSVKVNAFNENGEAISLDLNGWNARIVQHECDHLEGVPFTDRMDPKTLQCTCWQTVNDKAGRIELPFYSKK